MEESEVKKAEIIILSGYLGSGKTTFITRVLQNKVGLRVAVIQNEFSKEMGIEAPVMVDQKGNLFDKFYELPNGCLCCSAKEDMVKAIEYFLQNQDYNNKLDYILVECNGLADPANTIRTLWADEEIEFPAIIQQINAVVDISRFETHKNEEIFRK